jgi:hypothetical protein
MVEDLSGVQVCERYDCDPALPLVPAFSRVVLAMLDQ